VTQAASSMGQTPSMGALGPLGIEQGVVGVRGLPSKPSVQFAQSGVRLVTPAGGLLLEAPWEDVVSVGVTVPLLPSWLWWTTLPIHALSGPTTAESRQVLCGLSRRSVPPDEWHLGRPTAAPYSRRTARLLDVMEDVLVRWNVPRKLADPVLMSQVLEELERRPRLGGPRSRKSDLAAMRTMFGLEGVAPVLL
jgi:hypothetical protein